MKKPINIILLFFTLFIYGNLFSQQFPVDDTLQYNRLQHIKHQSLRGLPIVDSLRYHHIKDITSETGIAEVVVEGRGLNNDWDNGFLSKQGSIFTSWRIKVLKVFKGDVKDSILEIISDGGIRSDGSMAESMWGGVGLGEEGLFFLRFNNTGIESGKGYQSCVFIGMNSWLRYQIIGRPFYPITHVDSYKINDLDKDLYPLIIAATHTQPKILGLNSLEIEAIKKRLDPDTLIQYDNRYIRVHKKDLNK